MNAESVGSPTGTATEKKNRVISDLLAALIFGATVLGIGWPLAARLSLHPVERILAAAILSLVAVFLAGWIIYVAALPPMAFAVLPLATAIGLFTGRRTLLASFRDAEVRSLLTAQLLVSGWCVGWLALVASYSGGSWAGDWFGHWQRVVFFLERAPTGILFNGFDPLPSRPPLANVVVGAFLRLSRFDFARYQLVLCLFSSLAFLPAALLTRRWGGARAMPVLALFFLASPLFVQNATYAWTKLPAAFFVLGALYFALRAREGNASPPSLVFAALAFASAVLVHYSAVAFVPVAATAWIAAAWKRREELAWRRATVAAITLSLALALVWFGWALATYGPRGTFLSNTTATDQAATAAGQLQVAALNVRDTLVPHFLRSSDATPFAQSSRLGRWRDWFFSLYQLNLFFAFGSIAWLAILFALARPWRAASRPARLLWLSGIALTILLGITVHAGRVTGGLVHICLQPLVLAGLAFLASQWDSLSRGWKTALLIGTAVDLVLGVLLHLGVQSQLFAPVAAYSPTAVLNARAKGWGSWEFLRDEVPRAALPLIATALAAMLAFAVRQAATAKRKV